MIKEITATIFEKYQVRKSKKQKTAFIEYIQGICEQNNIPCNVEKKESSRNIVMGTDPDDCEMVIAGHYDTCAKMIVPNFITPRNIFVFILYQLLLTALIMVPGFIVPVLISFFVPSTDLPPIAMMSYALVTGAMCILMIAGPANKHTANDNTSGTIAVLSSMLAMTPEQRSRVCFVLLTTRKSAYLAPPPLPPCTRT